MGDDHPTAPSAAEADSDLVDRAEALIGFEYVWSGQLLYTAVELGVIDLLGGTRSPRLRSRTASIWIPTTVIGSCGPSAITACWRRPRLVASH